MSNETGQYLPADESTEAADKLRKEEIDASTNDKIASLTNVIDKLRAELEEQSTYFEGVLRNDRANISMERTRLKIKIERCEYRLADSRRVIDNYSSRITELTKEKDALNVANKDLLEDNGRMTTQIAELGERLGQKRRLGYGNLDTIHELESKVSTLEDQLVSYESDADTCADALATCDVLRSQNAMLTIRVNAFENGEIASKKPILPQDVVLLDSIKPGVAASQAQTRELLDRIRSMSAEFQHTYAEIGACRTELRKSQEKLRAIEDSFRMFKAGDHSPTWAISFLHEHRSQNARLSFSMPSSKKNVWQMTWRPLAGKGDKRIEVFAETMELLNKAVFKAYTNDMPNHLDGVDNAKDEPLTVDEFSKLV